MTLEEREAIGVRCVELAVALTKHEAQMSLPITVAADLTVEVAGSRVQLTPTKGSPLANSLRGRAFAGR
jgi:phage head maturation protease